MGSLFDDYKDLIEFNPNNPELLSKLMYQTWLFNKSVDTENEPLALFMPVQCHRVASAIRIQSVFRGYLFRKRINEVQGQTFNEQIVERRAIIFIQKWWQWFKIKRRLEALSKIKNYLLSINSSTLYMEENLYINLEKIIRDVRSRTNFPEQKLDFDFIQGFEI